MNAELNVRKVSDGTGPSVHKYYDESPESPDGSRVLYFRFDGDIPGPGEIVVRRRGTDRHDVVARVPAARGHSGAFQVWLDNRRVAWLERDQAGKESVICDLEAGAVHRLGDAVAAWDKQGGIGLSDDHIRGFDGSSSNKQGVWSVDMESGEWSQLLSREQALELHPAVQGMPPETLGFKGVSWAPDGSRFFVGLTNAKLWRANPGEFPLVKSLFLAEPDGGNLRYLGGVPEHATWAPDGSGVFGYEKMRPYYPEPREWDEVHVCAMHPLDGTAPSILHAGPGCHATLNPSQTLVLTDAFGHPSAECKAVLLYKTGAIKPRVLASYEMGDTHWASGIHAHPAWNADGGRIYFNARDQDGLPQVYCIELD